ncbi:MAG: D-2-hydroxyacid dehydrogenase [Treponema sp.]|jgi:glycerate dehydrogenase|nr:D-2-hydroxyacid dehydrogenase [Treponema sp.]
MKIVILDGYAMNPGDLSWDGFDSLGEVTRYDRTPADRIAERIGDSEIVITNKVPITGEILDACPGVKYIGVTATGYNIIDTEAARKRGIPVTNVPSYATEITAQFAVALLLEVCGHAGAHDRAVHEGRWAGSADFCFWDYPLIELAGKTLGIIGFGRIGRAVGRIAKALGMKVIAHSPREHEEGRAIAGYVGLDRLLAESDVISLHCPLFPATQGIINSSTIAKMKDGVIIINNARGPLIVDQDLADALNSGKVYAAAVDVAVTEPIKADNPLLAAKNCIITPHISWAAAEARKRLIGIVVENIRAFAAGKPVNVVNP